jgi:glycosyltransferase involved in cell wall biosynthesis
MSRERVSIIMATYDRAATLGRAIDSVVRQDYDLWELIVVDDGSTDDTHEILRRYDDPRIVVVVHDRNRGVTAAKNTGLDRVIGEWFTFLDSDDEAVPNALSTMLSVADAHPDVDAVTCNCLDSRTHVFTGHGLDRDGYVDARAVALAWGEHWGITRTSLLRSLRFDERIPGGEEVVWLKISARATRYYINRGLRIYHTGGADRVSHQPRERRDAMHLLIAQDAEYLSLLEQIAPERYTDSVFQIVVAAASSGERAMAWRFFRRYNGSIPRRLFLLSECILGRPWLELMSLLRSRLAGR